MIVPFLMLYALVGLACAVTLAVREAAAPRTLDVLLLLLLWPLYAPFTLTRGTGPARSEVQTDFLEAIRRVEGTPLAALLPPTATAIALNDRVNAAERRVTEIEAMLGHSEFDEGAALARVTELEGKGEALAASIAAKRVQNIRRLKQLRDRFARELIEIRELLAQLRLQAELVRLAGAADGGSRDVVQMLLSRVEGLGAILDEEGALIGA